MITLKDPGIDWSWGARSYLHKFGLRNWCEDRFAESYDHIIFDCRLLDRFRQELIEGVLLTGDSWPPSKKDLLGEVKGGTWHLYWAGGRKDPVLSDILHETERYFKLNFPFLPPKQITAKAYEHLGIPHMFGIVDRGCLHKMYLDSRKSELPVIERSLRSFSAKTSYKSLQFPVKKKPFTTKVFNTSISTNKYHPLRRKSLIGESIGLGETPTSLGPRKSVTFQDGVSVIDISPNPTRKLASKSQENIPTRRPLNIPTGFKGKKSARQEGETILRQKAICSPEVLEKTISGDRANRDDSVISTKKSCPPSKSTLKNKSCKEINVDSKGKNFQNEENLITENNVFQQGHVEEEQNIVNEDDNTPGSDISVKSIQLTSVEKEVSNTSTSFNDNSNYEQYNNQTLFLNNFSLTRQCLKNKEVNEKNEMSQQLEIIESDGEINILPRRRRVCKMQKVLKIKKNKNVKQLKYKNKISSDSSKIEENLNDSSKSKILTEINNNSHSENVKVINEKNCDNARIEIQSIYGKENISLEDKELSLDKSIQSDVSFVETDGSRAADGISLPSPPKESDTSTIRASECDILLAQNASIQPVSFNTGFQESSIIHEDISKSQTILEESLWSSIPLSEEPQTRDSLRSKNLNSNKKQEMQTQSNDTCSFSPSTPKVLNPEQLINEECLLSKKSCQNILIPEKNDTALPTNNFSPISEPISPKSIESLSFSSDENPKACSSGQINNEIYKQNNFRESIIAQSRDSDESLSDAYSHSQESIDHSVIEGNTSELYNDSLSFLSKATNCLTLNEEEITSNKERSSIYPNFSQEKQLENEINDKLENNQHELFLTTEAEIDEIHKTKSSTVSVSYDSSLSFGSRTLESLKKNYNNISPIKISSQMKDVNQNLIGSESDSSINFSQNMKNISNNESFEEVSTAYETEKETGKLKISRFLEKKTSPNIKNVDENLNSVIQSDIIEFHPNLDRETIPISPKKNNLITTETLFGELHKEHGGVNWVKSTVVNLEEINKYHSSSDDLSGSVDIWSETSWVSESMDDEKVGIPREPKKEILDNDGKSFENVSSKESDNIARTNRNLMEGGEEHPLRKIEDYQESSKVSNLRINENSGQLNAYQAFLADEINKENQEFFEDKIMFLTKWVSSNNKIKIEDGKIKINQITKTKEEIYSPKDKQKHKYKGIDNDNNLLQGNTFDENSLPKKQYNKTHKRSQDDPTKQNDHIESEEILSHSYSEGITNNKKSEKLTLNWSLPRTCIASIMHTKGASVSNSKSDLHDVGSSEQKSSVSIIENSDSLEKEKKETVRRKSLGIYQVDLRGGGMNREINNLENEHKDNITESDTLFKPIERLATTIKSNIYESNKNKITASQELKSFNLDDRHSHTFSMLSFTNIEQNNLKENISKAVDKVINIKIEPEISVHESTTDESVITPKSSPSVIISSDEITLRKKKNIKKRKKRAMLLKNQPEIVQVFSTSDEEIQERPIRRRTSSRLRLGRANIGQSDSDRSKTGKLNIQEEGKHKQKEDYDNYFNGSTKKAERSGIITSETVNEHQKFTSPRDSDKHETKLTPIVISQSNKRNLSNVVNKKMDSSDIELKLDSDNFSYKQYDDQERLKSIQNKSRILAKELFSLQETKISPRKISTVVKKCIKEEENQLLPEDALKDSLIAFERFSETTGTSSKQISSEVCKPVTMREALQFDKWYRSQRSTGSNSTVSQENNNRNFRNKKNPIVQSNENKLLDKIMSNSENHTNFIEQDNTISMYFQNDNEFPLSQKHTFRRNISANENSPIKSKQQPLSEISNSSSNILVKKKKCYIYDNSDELKENNPSLYTKSHVILKNMNSADHNYDSLSLSDLSRKRKLNDLHIDDKRAKFLDVVNRTISERSSTPGSLGGRNRMAGKETEESFDGSSQGTKYSKSSTVRRIEVSAHNVSSSPPMETLIRRSFFMGKPSE